MRSRPLLFALVLLIAFPLSFAQNRVTTGKPQPPAVLSAKTIAFVTCFPGAQADEMKQQATAFFTKWKRYHVVPDPQQADLVVLLGPIPGYVSESNFRDVLSGHSPAKFAPPAATPAAQAAAPDSPPLFTVFDGPASRAPETHHFRSLWAHSLDESKVALSANDFKSYVSRSAENYNGNGFNFQVCQMLHTAFC
ncbi:MAG: hypothetical protein ABI383_07175 [Acidobacteriaceae bacterium]